MPRHRFKRFSDLAFIQRIDKPRYFGPLLKPCAGFFARQQLDVNRLTNDDDCDRRLLAAFTQLTDDFPPKLLELLYMLDDLADEAGHDRLIAEAERYGTDLSSIDREVSPEEFALAVHQLDEAITRICHEKTLHLKVKNYEEYQARGAQRLSLKSARGHLRTLEAAMAPWFESRNRSRACEIYVYEEEDEIKFQITHGRPFRTDASIDKELQRSRVAYRPQQHDSVIYDTRTGILKVSGQTFAEKELYRETFGKVLFGDVNYFPEGDLYELTALAKGEPLAPVVGIDYARFTEVWVQFSGSQRFLQISRAYDLLEAMKAHGTPDLRQGRIMRAAFLIKYSSGGRPRKLELRPPNVAVYDRDRDGEAVEAFLLENGFLKSKV